MSETFLKSFHTILMVLAAFALIQCSGGGGSPSIPGGPEDLGTPGSGALGLPSLDGSTVGGNPATGPQALEDSTPQDLPQVAIVEVTLTDADGDNDPQPGNGGQLSPSRYLAHANTKFDSTELTGSEAIEEEPEDKATGSLSFGDHPQEAIEPPPPFGGQNQPFVWVTKDDKLQRVLLGGKHVGIYEASSWGLTRIYFDWWPRGADRDKPCQHHFQVHACYFDGEQYYECEVLKFSCPITPSSNPMKFKIPLRGISTIRDCPPKFELPASEAKLP